MPVRARLLFLEHQIETIPSDFASEYYSLPRDRIDPIQVNCAAKSLFVFPYNGPLRYKCTRLVHHPVFKAVVLIAILLNSITLALRDPQTQSLRTLQNILDITDYVFICFFAFEMILKICVQGLFAHSKSYLRHMWNLLDATVVVSGGMSVFLNAGSGVSALRVIRVFRPLRAFSYVKSLRHILTRIFISVPKMVNVFFLLIFIIWVLDVVAVHLFMGTLNQRCFADVSSLSNTSDAVNTSDSSLVVNRVDNIDFVLINNFTRRCAIEFSGGISCATEQTGVVLPQRCLRIADDQLQVPFSIYNYNNAFYGFLLVFKIVCRDNWPDDLNHLSEAIGIGGAFGFMFVATMFAGYFCVNLFIAVFETVFSSKDMSDDILPSRTAVKFTTVLGARTVSNPLVFCCTWKGRTDTSPRRHVEPTAGTGDGGEQSIFTRLEQLADLTATDEPVVDDLRPATSGSTSPTWKSRIKAFFKRTGVARVARICNTGYYQLFIMALVVINAAFLAMDRVGNSDSMTQVVGVVTFVLTILFNLDAIIKITAFGPSYFTSVMNTFDFVLCLISIPDIVNFNSSAFTALRAFRLLRLLRVSQRWKDLQQKLDLLEQAVEAVGSLSLVAFIVIYIYAILGFQLFGSHLPGMHMSFETVFDSLLTVFICITGEDQDDIAAVVAEQSGLASVIYFISLTIFGNFVLTNLFIAIILENFATSSDASVADGSDSDDDDVIRRGALRRATMFVEMLPPTAHDPHLTVHPMFLDSNEPTLASLSQKRILLEPDDVELNDSVASSSRRLVCTKSSGSMQEEESAGNAGATGEDTASTVSVNSPRAAQYRTVGADIQRALGLGSHASEMFALYAKETKAQQTALVPDATTLAAEAEQHMLELNAEWERQQEQFSTFASVVSRVMSNMRKKRAQPTPRQKEVSSPSGFTLEDFSVKLGKFKTTAERQSLAQKWAGLESTSMGCISANNRLRRFIGKVLKHPVTEWVMVCVTLASSVMLAFDNAALQETLGDVIVVTDYVFCGIFVTEAIVKMFALGLVKHDGSYFRSVWNCIDLFVAFFSLIALFESSLKLFRSFRVLRFLNLSFTLRVITSSIVAAVPGMASVTVFVGLLFFIYALFGVGLFKGYLNSCTDPAVQSKADCYGTYLVPTPSAFNMTYVNTTREWRPSIIGCTYDNIEGALMCLFAMANQDNWFEQMYAAVNHAYRSESSSRNANPLASLYFISFMVVGQFFSVNLFIGVLVDRFLQQRRKGEGHAFLTPSQEQWILVQKVLFRAEVRGQPQRPENWTAPVFDLCSHRLFDIIMYALIAANSVLLSAYYLEMSSSLRTMFDSINIALIAMFTLEIVLKCIAFGPMSYFATQWNRLDVFVVTLSWLGIGLSASVPALGVLRVSRLLMLLRKMKGLQTLFVTLYHAIPEFLNVALVLMVLYFIFAVIGAQLFGKVARGTVINEFVNFEHVGSASVSLYIMMTQESWGDIMDELAAQSTAARPFCVIFMILVSWVAINLLVTVVIDVFGEAEETEMQDASLKVIDAFRQVWCLHDPNGNKLLPAGTVIRILPTMPSSIWDRSAVSAQGAQHLSPWRCVLRQLERLHIPLDGQKRVRYEDCVGSLALRLFSLSVAEAIQVSQSTVHGVSWKNSHYSIHHEFAALRISKFYRRYRETRRERQLEAQVRLLRNQHRIAIDSELRPLRHAYHDAILLLRWMAKRNSGGCGETFGDSSDDRDNNENCSDKQSDVVFLDAESVHDDNESGFFSRENGGLREQTGRSSPPESDSQTAQPSPYQRQAQQNTNSGWSLTVKDS